MFADNNHNGTYDGGDIGRGESTVYVDLNNNGTIDSGEPNKTTTADGTYLFDNIPAGTGYLRVKDPNNGWGTASDAADSIHGTTTAGQILGNLNFGLVPELRPPAYYYSNEGEVVSSTTAYLEQNNQLGLQTTGPNADRLLGSGTTGPIDFQSVDVSAGWHTVYILIKHPDNSTRVYSGGKNVGVLPGRASLSAAVINLAGNPASPYGNSVPNLTLYLDANLNGKLDPGETSSTTDTGGHAGIVNMQPNKMYRIREILPPGYRFFDPTQQYLDFTPMDASDGYLSLWVVANNSMGTFHSGTFHLDAGNDHMPAGDITVATGVPNGVPVVGDWNGDGLSDLGLRIGNRFYLDTDGNRQWNLGDRSFAFGKATDIPVAGNFAGDFKSEIGVFRDGTWILDSNNNGAIDASDAILNFGQAGDTPVVGDWNGDGISDVGVYRGHKFILDSDGDRKMTAADAAFLFGIDGDKPIIGDWNFDGKADVGVYRGNTFYLDGDGSRSWDKTIDLTFNYGNSGDTPIVGIWI